MMKIGFDAKRAFYNNRGLGNYSRELIRVLSEHQAENQYYLYTPGTENAIHTYYPPNCEIVEPTSPFYRTLPSLWRSYGQCKEIKSQRLDVFHGLSHELPFSIEKTKVRTVVTMHDLIFYKFPELYPWIDRQLYKRKYFRSCSIADKIIAISEQTRIDLIELAGIQEQRIEVVYQGCNPIFQQTVGSMELDLIRKKYNLPAQFLLNVGAIERRKNQELIIKAIALGKIDIPLVIVGRPTDYYKELKALIAKHRQDSRVLFLTDVPTEDLPGIYQMAEVFVYPSLFEGFGIPIIEALQSKVPVVTSKGSCFAETGGPDSCYVSPDNVEELAEVLRQTLDSYDKRNFMIRSGLQYAEKFSDSHIADSLMNVYRQIQ